MHRLARGVEQEQPAREGDRPLGLARLGQVVEQRAQGAQGQFAEPVSLHRQPVVEGRVGGPEPFEQLPPVEHSGARQGLGPAFSDETLEIGDVAVHRARIQAHRLASGIERRGVGAVQGPAEFRQRLAQAAAGLFLGPVAP